MIYRVPLKFMSINLIKDTLNSSQVRFSTEKAMPYSGFKPKTFGFQLPVEPFRLKIPGNVPSNIIFPSKTFFWFGDFCLS
jgi:hypothetical protein